MLYVIDSLATGGSERSLVEMAPYLVAEAIDLRVAVLHDRPGLAQTLRELGVSVEVVAGAGRAAWVAGLRRSIVADPPDLVHTTLFDADVVGRFAARLARVPVVSSLVNTPYGREHRREAGVGRARLLGAQGLDALTARFACRFHAVSEATAAACAKRVRIPRPKIDVIPRGRDLGRMGRRSPERRKRARGSLGLQDRDHVVLSVARQEPQKGIDVFLAAVAELRRSGLPVVGIVAGADGRATPGLRRMAQQLGLVGPGLQWLGSRSDIADILCAADVFTLPSRREGLPGAVIEAMAMEVPVVVSDLPTVREVVPDLRHGWLVPVDDAAALAAAIRSSLDDPVVSRARVAAARARVESRFDVAGVSRQVVEFYRRALRECRRVA